MFNEGNLYQQLLVIKGTFYMYLSRGWRNHGLGGKEPPQISAIHVDLKSFL